MFFWHADLKLMPGWGTMDRVEGLLWLFKSKISGEKVKETAKEWSVKQEDVIGDQCLLLFCTFQVSLTFPSVFTNSISLSSGVRVFCQSEFLGNLQRGTDWSSRCGICGESTAEDLRRHHQKGQNAFSRIFCFKKSTKEGTMIEKEKFEAKEVYWQQLNEQKFVRCVWLICRVPVWYKDLRRWSFTAKRMCMASWREALPDDKRQLRSWMHIRGKKRIYRKKKHIVWILVKFLQPDWQSFLCCLFTVAHTLCSWWPFTSRRTVLKARSFSRRENSISYVFHQQLIVSGVGCVIKRFTKCEILWFQVDLAGSECIGRSGAVDKRAREAGKFLSNSFVSRQATSTKCVMPSLSKKRQNFCFVFYLHWAAIFQCCGFLSHLQVK